MFGKLNESEIEGTLRSQALGRIGCHYDGLTYVTPISYAYHDGYVYCHTREGMKVRMMRNNPKVCFEVDEISDMANWKSVIGWGDFEELISAEDRKTGMGLLVGRVLPMISSETTHLSPHWPFPSSDIEDIKGIIFRIKLTTKTGRFEKFDQVSEHRFA